MPGFQLNVGIRGRQDPADLATVERAYNKLELAHQSTIQNASMQKQAIAELDLNASEEGFRQELINQIDSAVDDNLLFGNAATAMDDVWKAIGDIKSNPKLIGRLRAQTEYKAWQDKLDKSALPQDYKNYFKKKNTYYYEDKYDDNGNIIGGSEWKPQKEWVDAIDYNTIMQQAIQTAAKESGGGTQHYFIDKNGNRTTDMSKATNAMYIDSVTGQWTKLSENKIKQAYYGIINANPAYRAAVQQDWEVANDVYKTDKIDKYGIVGKDGYIMSKDQWLANKIDPVAASAAYYNYKSSSSIKEGIGASLAAAALANGGNGDGYSGNPFDVPAYRGAPIRYENEAPALETANKEQSKANINKYFPDYNFNNYSYDEVLKLINDSDFDSNTKFNLKQSLNVYNRSKSYLDKLTKGLQPEQTNAVETKLALDSGGELPAGGKYSNMWKEFAENLFNNTSDSETKSIGVDYNTTEVNAFIDSYPGGREALERLGITFRNKGDYTAIELTSDNKNNLYQFIKVNKELHKNISFWDKLDLFSNEGELYQLDENGNKSSITVGLERPYENRMASKILPDIVGKPLAKLDHWKTGVSTDDAYNVFLHGEELYEIMDREFKYNIKGSMIETSNPVRNGPNVLYSYYDNKFYQTGDNKWKAKADRLEQQAITALQGSGLTQYDIYGYDENESKGNFTRLSSQRRYDIQNEINSGNYDLSKIQFSNSTFKGQPMTQVTLFPTSKFIGESKPLKFFIRNFGVDKFTQDYANQPEAIADAVVKTYTDSGLDIDITDINPIFEGLDRINITPVNHELYTVNNLSTGQKANINGTMATTLKASIFRIEETINVIRSLGAIPETTEKELDDAIEDYCAIIGANFDSVKEVILNNISQ